jgi:Site-specific recombinases, DNA invertase Pin homologs
MIYGYCRVSTKEQSITRQVRNITEKYPSAKIVRDYYTGTRTEGRKGWEGLFAKVTSGDTIVFDSVSRMSRNAAEGFAAYKDLYNRGVDLVFLKEPAVDTSVYRTAENREISEIKTGDEISDELLNGIIAAVNRALLRIAEKQIHIEFKNSEREVLTLRERTIEGMKTARDNGKQIGLKTGAKLTVKKAAPAKEIIRTHCRTFGGSNTDAETMKLAGIAKNTYYRYKKEIAAEMSK